MFISKKLFIQRCALIISLCCGVGCSDPVESTRVQMPVVVDSSAIVPVTTDLNYRIEVTSFQFAMSDMLFTVAGEVHDDSAMNAMKSIFVSNAYAHPGHYEGGEVTGELKGRFTADWMHDNGKVLGDATLLAGDYKAANFTFDRGSKDLLEEGDPLIGHTAIIKGKAIKGEEVVDFIVVIDSPEGRVLVGAPFEAKIDDRSAGKIKVRVELKDAIEQDTLFDGLDFLSLDADGDKQLTIQSDNEDLKAYYNIRQRFQTHDHYTLAVEYE